MHVGNVPIVAQQATPWLVGGSRSRVITIPRVLGTVVLVAGLLTGLLLRLDGIDRGPLTVDEYYSLQAVHFILDSGVPQFPAGGFYIRGLLPNYAIAASVLLLGESDFAYRLPGVLWSLLSVWLTFIYCRRFTGRVPAIGVALAMLLSSWQIEFALFVRMYGALQCVTLLFLLALDDAFFRGRWNRRYVPHLLAVVVTLTHFLGILLTPLLFLPLVLRGGAWRSSSRSARLKFLAAGIAVLLVCLVIVDDDARDWGVTAARPADYVSKPRGERSNFWLPEQVLWSPGNGKKTDLAIVAGLLLGVGGLLELARRRSGKITRPEIFAVLLLLATATHMFWLSAGFLGVMLLRYGFPRRGDPARSRILLLVGASGVTGLAWLVYAWRAMPSLAPGAVGLVDAVKLARKIFFDWPQFYRGFGMLWLEHLPLLALALIAALGVQAIVMRRSSLERLLRQPAFLVVYVVACMALLKPSYSEIRYSFFMYPVILCAIAVGVRSVVLHGTWVRSVRGGHRAVVAACALFLLVFGFSSDFNPEHIAAVSSREVTYRLSGFERFERLWYPRLDFESPATFLDQQVGQERDRVIVVNEPPVSFYVGRPHGVYYDRSHRRFTNVTRAGGTIDMWSNQQLLSTARDLRWFTHDATTVWLVQSARPEERPFDSAGIWGDRFLEASPAFLSRDGRIEVVQVTLRPPPGGLQPLIALASSR